MRAIKVYCPPGVEPPLYAFIDALDGKLKAKLLWQIFRLRNLPACELKEPHFKHFSLERYSQMYELREKGKVLIRIVFTVQNEDVILLTSFIKRQPRDTKKALDQSLYIPQPLWRMRARDGRCTQSPATAKTSHSSTTMARASLQLRINPVVEMNPLLPLARARSC